MIEIAILFISAAMLTAGFSIYKKTKENDKRLAGEGLIFFGRLILLTDMFLIAYKYESPVSYILFALIIIAISAIGIYAEFRKSE